MISKKVFHLLLAIFITATGFSQSNLDSILYDFHNRPDNILVASHRATHVIYPENSLAAMKEAIRLGVDIIETDVRETKDGVLVIMHDKTIDRTTTGKGNVADLTYAQLQQYFLVFNGKPTGEKIPTFKAVLDLVKGKIMLDIDYKADGKRAAKSTTTLLKKTKSEKQCLFFLYDYKDAAALNRMDKKIQFMIRAYNRNDIEEILKLDFPIPAVHADDKCYTDSLMQVIRSKGKRLWMNALGKYDSLEKEKTGAGFDAILQMRFTNIIQTDRPGELLEYLRKRGLHR